nr:MAG TPA: hypothetical protein [Caudoviricetes sp.]
MLSFKAGVDLSTFFHYTYALLLNSYSTLIVFASQPYL